MTHGFIELDGLKDRTDVEPDELTDGFFLALSEKVERMVSTAGQGALETLNSKIGEAFRSVYHAAQPDVKRSLRDKLKGSVSQAYRLGQLNAMQAVAAKAAGKRVSEEFIEAIGQSKFKGILTKLWVREMSGIELHKVLGESKESLSRKLVDLRALGITSFVKDGKEVRNFLTPAARALIPQIHKLEDPGSSHVELDARNAELEPAQQHAPTFARRKAR